MREAHRDVSSSVLGTDQYQLTMAQVYWREGMAGQPAQFDYFFRSYPDYGTHQAGYCVAAGLDPLLAWMEQARFGATEIELMAGQRTEAGTPRFDPGFLTWLEEHGDFSALTIRAVPEGRVVHAHAPVAVVEGPLALAQILETALLNRLNYPTLVATKASRVKEAARGRPILEFGLRRGPEEGAMAGSRAALIGGCDFTSNVAASIPYGLDPKGTHAHSMVQAFLASGATELDAFRAFAASFPDECVLLVDTIDTLESGVPNAIRVFEELRSGGHRPQGIRLDSGDLAYLAIRSAQMLDEAGFDDTDIVLSSDLDELVIWQILSQIDAEAARYGVDPEHLADRLVYGVGTRLITSHGDSALSGVYKLTALEQEGAWSPAIKISESTSKIPVPGPKQLWRAYDSRGYATADVLALPGENLGAEGDLRLFHPYRDAERTVPSNDLTEYEELLETLFRGGARLRGAEPIEVLRARREADLQRLDPGVRRIVSPHIYHVSLTEPMKRLQQDLIKRARSGQRT